MKKNSKVAYTGKEVSKFCSSYDEMIETMDQCEVCGAMYCKEDGLSNFIFDEYEYGHTCNDCISDLKNNISINEIQYTDEFCKVFFTESISAFENSCRMDDYKFNDEVY